MKIKIIFFIVFAILLSISTFAQFQGNNNTDDIKSKLISATKYSKEDIKSVNELSFNENSLFAYEICGKIRTAIIDEAFLDNLSIYQNTALVRTLVENETITSINQIPFKSLNIFDYNEELAFSHMVQSVKNSPKKDNLPSSTKKDSIGTTDNALEYDENGKLKTRIIVDIKPVTEKDLYHMRSPYENSLSFFSRIATYALVEKYPLNAERLVYDYINKYGYDQLTYLFILYFIERKEYKKAADIIETIEHKFYEVLRDNDIIELQKAKVMLHIAEEDIKNGEVIINNLYDTASEDDKIYILEFKLQMYYLFGLDKSYSEDTEKIKNELIIAAKDSYDKKVERHKNLDVQTNEIEPFDINKIAIMKPKPKQFIFDYKYGVTVAYMPDILCYY